LKPIDLIALGMGLVAIIWADNHFVKSERTPAELQSYSNLNHIDR